MRGPTSDLHNLQDAITILMLQRRKWKCQVINLSKVIQLVTGGAGARAQQSRAHYTHITLQLQCLQRFHQALRINPQTPSSHPHLPPLHASSLAFLHFLQHHLLFPAPGPLHMLCPLCEILSPHFSRFKPAHVLSLVQRPSFTSTPD